MKRNIWEIKELCEIQERKKGKGNKWKNGINKYGKENKNKWENKGKWK